jgi:hypothetical protein
MWIVAVKADRSMLEGLDLPQSKISYSAESCRRQFARAVGAMLCQNDYTALKRNPDDVAYGMDRLKAIGNGQNPFVAATAWLALTKGKQGGSNA